MITDKGLTPGFKKIDFFVGIPVLFIVGFIRDLSDFFWRPLKRFLWYFKRSRRQSKPRILIIKYSNLDEAVQMLPALHLIKKNFKEAHINFLGGPAIGTFFMKSKVVDRAEAFSFSTVIDIMSASFMMVVDFEKCMRITGITTALMKAPFSVGFDTNGEYRASGFDESLEHDEKISEGENFWNLAVLACEQCGHSPSSKYEEDRKEIRSVLKQLLPEKAENTIKMNLPSNYVVFSPSAEKTESWFEIYRNLKSAEPQTDILLVGHGGHEKRKAYQSLVDEGATSWVDKVSFEELFQILNKAKKIYTMEDYVYEMALLLNDHVEVVK